MSWTAAAGPKQFHLVDLSWKGAGALDMVSSGARKEMALVEGAASAASS